MTLRDWLRRRQTVEEALIDSGVPTEEIERAASVGGLELLAIDRLLEEAPRELTQQEISEESGLPIDIVSRAWRSLGFPAVGPDERVFTRLDADMSALVASLMARGLADPELTLQMGRVIGQSLSRVAAAQVAVMVDRRVGAGDEEIPFAQRAELLIDVMPRVMDYVWRRHLEIESRRRLAQLEGADEAGAPIVVGFADLVGFTALSQQLPEDELAHVVERFEQVATDVVTSHGGRLVKMIGDEVMFSAGDVKAGAEIGLGLAEHFHTEEAVSDVRVGLAWGPVLQHEGDLYGPTVNLASRVVGIAYPGAVLVPTEMADAIGEDPDYQLVSIRSHTLRDIGRIQLCLLRRAQEQQSLLDKARLRREIGRAWIEEKFGSR